MDFTPEDLLADLQNEQQFLDFFEQKNIETISFFQKQKEYNSLSDCFLIKHNDSLPRIGLVFLKNSPCPEKLALEVINKYKMLFEKWAKFERK